jgi:hypothetical protein
VEGALPALALAVEFGDQLGDLLVDLPLPEPQVLAGDLQDGVAGVVVLVTVGRRDPEVVLEDEVALDVVLETDVVARLEQFPARLRLGHLERHPFVDDRVVVVDVVDEFDRGAGREPHQAGVGGELWEEDGGPAGDPRHRLDERLVDPVEVVDLDPDREPLVGEVARRQDDVVEEVVEDLLTGEGLEEVSQLVRLAGARPRSTPHGRTCDVLPNISFRGPGSVERRRRGAPTGTPRPHRTPARSTVPGRRTVPRVRDSRRLESTWKRSDVRIGPT